MTKQKIAFLINSLDGGGAERVITTLVNEFIKEYDCYLILIENKIEYKIDDRINLIILNDKKVENSFSKLFMIPFLSFKLSKIIKEQKFSQILSFLHRSNYINILSSIFSKHKVIISERTTPSAMYNDKTILSFVNKFLTTHLYNKADVIIPASIGIKNDLINNFNLRKEQKVIYNPCNVESIQQQSNELINFSLNKERTIITVGSLEKVKNQEILIKSFSKLEKDYKLIIVGQGKLEQLLKNLVKELNLENQVIFVGFDVNPYKYMSKSSIFVLTSNSEGFPNVLVEAMICGCNVISTDCSSGPREILAPNSDIRKSLINDIEFAEYGILIPINNELKLVEALNTIITNIELQTKYKEIATKRIQELQIDIILPQYKILLERSLKKEKQINVVAFSKYSYDGPSSRYRFYNYVNSFKKENINFKINPLFNKCYFSAKNKFQKILIVLLSYIKRFFQIIALLVNHKKIDLVVIEYELFPYFPAIFEYILKKRNIKYFVDYDDAIFHKYDLNKNKIIKFLLKDKIANVIKYASKVIVCNSYLENYAKKYNNNIFKLPTVVILEKYLKTVNSIKNDDFIIGWIGSKTTSIYILDILESIKDFVKKYPNVQFNLVGFDNNLLSEKEIHECNINIIKWQEETEVDNILNFDVGIMPLDDTPWSRGKCGFKLIQYMSCKKPLIASAVGVNTEIIDDGENGILIYNKNEWFNAFEKLYLNKSLREKMSSNNYERINKYYNHNENIKKYIYEINLNKVDNNEI